MSVAARKREQLAVPDFIELIRPYPDEERWELLDGEAVLMAPPTARHQVIVANLLREVDSAARQRGCLVLPGLGMLNDDIDDFAPIPDVVVRCGPIGRDGYAKDPIVIAEVLPPSTMSNDRGRKVDFYKTMPSLRTLLVVYHDEMRVEVWQRAEDDRWRFAVRRRENAEIDLPEIRSKLRVADIYADVVLDEAG